MAAEILTRSRSFSRRSLAQTPWRLLGGSFSGMFEAVGRGGQRINIWPAKNLVRVFTGGEFEPGDLAKFILKALKSDEPLRTNAEASQELRKQIANLRRCISYTK